MSSSLETTAPDYENSTNAIALNTRFQHGRIHRIKGTHPITSQRNPSWESAACRAKPELAVSGFKSDFPLAKRWLLSRRLGLCRVQFPHLWGTSTPGNFWKKQEVAGIENVDSFPSTDIFIVREKPLVFFFFPLLLFTLCCSVLLFGLVFNTST